MIYNLGGHRDILRATYSGDNSFDYRKDGHWELRITESGTLTLENRAVVDIFCCGGGGAGGGGVYWKNVTRTLTDTDGLKFYQFHGAGGGGGGYFETIKGIELEPNVSYVITIGSGGAGVSGGDGGDGSASSIYTHTNEKIISCAGGKGGIAVGKFGSSDLRTIKTGGDGGTGGAGGGVSFELIDAKQGTPLIINRVLKEDGSAYSSGQTGTATWAGWTAPEFATANFRSTGGSGSSVVGWAFGEKEYETPAQYEVDTEKVSGKYGFIYGAGGDGGGYFLPNAYYSTLDNFKCGTGYLGYSYISDGVYWLANHRQPEGETGAGFGACQITGTVAGIYPSDYDGLNGTSGKANTGGGGGGASASSASGTTYKGGDGGSGIIIIRNHIETEEET